MDVPPDIRRAYVRRRTVDGVKLKVELLPSLWRKAPFYGIMITSPSAATVTLKIDRSFERATDRDFEKLLSRIRTAPCSRPRCTKRYLVGDETAAQNPSRVCRRHWMGDLRAEAAREQAAADDRTTREDERARRKGLRYRAIVWIHANGDDRYLVQYFARKPDSGQLRKIAARHHSKILEDHSVIRL
jgi:hypothetical protein